jgi:thiol-disulfide isomerase/thioredoxin/NAD-dependent dihydropyrimidine dehydrogenase PreA subunit
LLLNANIKGFLSGKIYSSAIGTKFMCAPGINCYSCPGASMACPMGALQNSFSAGKSTLAYVFGILLLYGIILGRTICGWICPFGLIQELLHKIPTPKLKKSKVTRAMSWLKYVILVVFGILVPILYAIRNVPLPAFCKFICPAGTLEGGLVLLSYKVNSGLWEGLGVLFTWKFLLLVSILVSCVFIYRTFCRFLCPLGAFYGLFNRFCLVGVQVDADKCIQCGLCIKQCKVDIRHVGDAECINCGECISVCPTQAISWKGPKVLKQQTGKKKTIWRIVAAVVLLAVLAGSIVYCWNTTPSLDSATVGCQPGQQLPGMDLSLITSQGIQIETIDPTATGKVTVINFWGTWCGGCVEELPYFDQIAREYAERVQVIAIHTESLSDTAPAYIQTNYPDSPIIFAKDVPSQGMDAYYSLAGGLGGYPYTVVIDENGVVQTTISNTLTYEKLRQIVEDALAS